MERRLEDFIASVEKLSDIRNIDPLNPIMFIIEQPVTAAKFTIVGAINEPSYGGVPINTTWIVFNPTLSTYRKALKLKAPVYDGGVTYGGKVPKTGFVQAWVELDTYDEIFEDAQYVYPTGIGQPGPQGPVGPMGPEGPQGATPTIDYQYIINAVVQIIQGNAQLVITGLTEVGEGTSTPYTVTLVTAVETLTVPVQITSSDPSFTLDGNNIGTAGTVTTNTPVQLTATYVYQGNTLTATHGITIVNAGLQSIVINALSSVFEGNSVTLTTTAGYTNGTQQTVTPVYEVSPLSAGSVVGDQFVSALVGADVVATVTATYTESGITRTAVKAITVRNLVPQSLAIEGNLSNIMEQTTSQLVAVVTANDGSTATVQAQWTVDPACGTIDGNGLFTAADITVNQAGTVTATYTANGVTVQASAQVTVEAQVGAAPFFGTGAPDAVLDSAFIQSLTGRGTAGTRLSSSTIITANGNLAQYYAYPVSYGLATFTDISPGSPGFPGGMDGASRDGGMTLGPVTVASVLVPGYSAVDYYVYQSDQTNLGEVTWRIE